MQRQFRHYRLRSVKHNLTYSFAALAKVFTEYQEVVL